MVNEVKYLGIKLGGRDRNIFREEKRAWMKKAQINVAQIMAQVERSYDRVTVGKAMWKQVMVAALLFGKAVVVAIKTTIKKIQAIENRVYRYLLGVAGYATIASLRSEIGASRMETRVMETQLLYAKDTMTGTFEKIKNYMEHDILTGRSEWSRTADTY